MLISPLTVLYLLMILGLAVLFYRAAVNARLTLVLFVAIMTLSAVLTAVGIEMLTGQDAKWEGIVLTCSGLALLLASTVACVLLCGRRNSPAPFEYQHTRSQSPPSGDPQRSESEER